MPSWCDIKSSVKWRFNICWPLWGVCALALISLNQLDLRTVLRSMFDRGMAKRFRWGLNVTPPSPYLIRPVTWKVPSQNLNEKGRFWCSGPKPCHNDVVGWNGHQFSDVSSIDTGPQNSIFHHRKGNFSERAIGPCLVAEDPSRVSRLALRIEFLRNRIVWWFCQ